MSKGLYRLTFALLAVLGIGSFQPAQAAVCQLVQSGTAVNNANGIQTITISSVDTTKSILIFQTRSNSNRPVGSEVRGRLQSATTIQFERVTNEVAPAVIDIQWYVVTFGSGVKVQRGEVTQAAATTDVTITAVAALSQAFVLWSKTASSGDNTWGADDAVLGELTTTTNLEFRANLLNAAHIIAWQVVEFTNAADINVQKGTATLTGATTSVTATLSPAVNVNKTFVLVGARTTDGSGPDMGAKMVRAQLTNSTTITIDRGAATTADVTEVVWQAVELKDGSTVWNGSANFAAGASQATAGLGLPDVNTARAVAFISGQGAGGQSMGRTSYVGDDIPGVASATASFTSTLLTLNRDNTVASADVGWFVVQFAGLSSFKVGAFTKSTGGAPVAQAIAHGLGQVPKAMILWTEGRTDETFSNSISFRAASSAGATTGVLTLTVNVPAGTLQNDVMIASIGFRPNTAVINAPAGWTLRRRTDNSGGNSLATYYRVAGASEPASYNWTFDTSTGSVGGILSFAGVNTASPIDLDAGQNTPNGLIHDAPSVTTGGANEMIVTAHAFMSGATWTPPTGMTEAVDASSDPVPYCCGISMEMNYMPKSAAGATGTLTATAANDADVGNTETLALKGDVTLGTQAYFGFGMTDGTTSKSASASSQNGVAAGSAASSSRIANKALTIVKWGSVVLAEADLQSWDDTNFTLNWTTNDTAAYVIHYLAIGGTDVSAKVVGWTTGTTTGNKAVTGVGFQPAVVMHAWENYQQTAAPPSNGAREAFGLGAMDANGNQWATAYFGVSGASPSDTQRGQQTDACVFSFSGSLAVQKKASFASMDADGFTVNFTNSTSGNNAQMFSLALAGLNVSVGNFLKATGAAPASQSITGVNFQPSAVLLASFQDVTQANAVAQARFGIGASDGSSRGSSALQDQDAQATTNMSAIDKTSKVFVKVNNTTPLIDAEADLSTMDADGFTLNWTTNDAVQTQMLYLAFGPLAATEVRLISFNASKYDRGVLLQWRTGYEIDNLGFNLYRDVDGVRTKVNSSLVAGSGLSAKRGTAVTSVLSYARWDLDPAAATDGVSYWLEDVDFKGKRTLHGPVAPVAGSLQAPDTVASSGDLKDLGGHAKDRKVFFKHNDDLARRTRGSWTKQPQSQIETQWALAGQATIKIGVRAPGWYRVSQQDLVAAGLNPRVDPRTLALFVDGTELAMRVTGESDGRFDAGDAIEFYGTGIDTSFTDTRVYWLAAGGQRGARIDTIGSAGAGSVKAGPTSFWSTLQRKDRSIYFSSLENGDADNWFGPLVSSEPIDLTMTADHIDRAASGPAQLTMVLQGVTTASDGSSGHRVGVLLNGTEVGEITFLGQGHSEQTLQVPMEALIDGDNTVTLVARNGDADWSLVDLVRLGYWHTFRADEDRLRFSLGQAGPVTVSGFASPSIRVVDVTDPAAAVELRGTVRTGSDGLSSIALRVAGPAPRTLLAFSEPTVGAPVFVRRNQPSTWHAATQAHDYVVISHGDFVEQVKPLVAARERQGHHTAVIDVDDVYDEFNFGEKTPQAIRDLLKWAQTNWQEQPRFVVLVGDATIDPRDYAGLGQADFVPTKQVPMVQIALETASDDWFADFNDDGLPEIAIGRLSVRTPEQARAMVSKIVDYDRTPIQPWAKNVLLVADAGDNNANFEQQSEDLAALLPSGYVPNRVFRQVLGDDPAHQTLIDRVNDGQLVVNYTGHGSVGIWGSDGQLLTNDDVAASFANAGRLPFVVTMNCLNGLFDQIWDEESLAEAWMRAPHGGAVAVWASSSVTPSATQALVDRELFRLLFNGTYATIGEAVAAAKRVVSNRDLRRSWIFFGDPAQHLLGAPMPASTRQTPVATPMAAAAGVAAADASTQPASTPETLAALDRRPATVRLMDSNSDGRADLWLYAPDSGRWAAVMNGAAGMSAVGSGMWDRGWQVVAADVNGDRRADFVFYRNDTGEWVQALAAANGTFAFTRGALGAVLPHAQLAVGDFNGDRRDDLLVYSPDSGSWVLAFSDGDGAFTTRRGTWPGGLRVHAADFNGDAIADVFAYDPTTGTGLLAMAKRDGLFTVTTRNWGPGWRVATANLDSNAAADLLFYAPATGAWQEAFNDGAGHFTMRTGAWPSGLELHVADLDGDRRDDVVSYNPATGQVVMAMNTAPGRFATTTASWTTGWTIAVGDVDGDGRDDLVLYDSTTGIWIQCLSIGSGAFVFSGGTWMPDGSFVGSPR